VALWRGVAYCRDMNTPKYFWAVLTACAMLLSMAGMLSLRWMPTQNEGVVLDTWRGALCSSNACVSVKHPVVDETRDPFAGLAR
jgi:hypothetical protein